MSGTQTEKRLAGVARKLGVAVPETEETAKAIGGLLQQDGRATQLRRHVTGNPAEVKTIAETLFPDLPEEERVDALADLVSLLLQAEDPTSGAPLLSARYHFFLRSLEGAFLSFTPSKTVLLDRRSAGEAALFEVGLCRECGQHYLVGRIMKDKLLEAIRDPGRADFGASFFLPMEKGPLEDEDADEAGAQTYRLCGYCGEIRRLPEPLRCNHNGEILLQKQEGEEGEDKIPRCSVCGYQGPDPVREVVHGTDGPHAVIATTLYQNLPPDRRKVLAFADGRQEAAFFAWYLDHSYNDILGRNLLLKVAQKQSAHCSEGSSLQDVATALRDIFRQCDVFPPATSDLQLRREAWLALYREFLTDEPRISLAGVGLARWSIRWPDWFHVPQFLREPPWSLTEQQARDLIFLLLDSMRADRAVEVRTDGTVSLTWRDLQLQASQMRFRIGQPAGQANVRSWDGVDQWGRVRHTKRTAILEKLLPANLTDQQKLERAVAALRQIWETIGQCDARAPTSNDRLLIAVEDARRLNPDWWRLRYIANADALYRCDTCGRIQAVSVRGVCPRHRCPGRLRETRRSELEPNHYQLLYELALPGSLRVEEHTAQLDKEKAREFQREFRDGKIHVLSCSTTFELGVDLGNLDTIFLRNVPPEAFNYAQRVGRSGRRSGHPGFAVTYCKRGPHDLYHFAEPLRMLSGKVQPPVLALRNERIITRHIAAVALSLFFRQFKERFPEVQNLFTDLRSPTALRDFRSFLLSNRKRIEQTLAEILPSEVEAFANGRWIDKIAGDNSRFALAEAEVSSDYKTVIGIEENARNSRDYRTAEWAQRRAETIAKETVLSFLSRKAVIPKYGFPVDVVELDTQRTHQPGHEGYEVSLQRDLAIAISEFAPTSKLVANKKEWTSYGLKKVAEREWPRKYYARCSTHNVFLQWNEGEPKPTMPCGDSVHPRKYVIPAFGFVTDRNKPKDPKARPAKVFSTRPYFARSLATEPGEIQMPAAASSLLATVTKASPGLMVVICEGRGGAGFYLCGGCGACFRKRQNQHITPQGQQCKGTLEQVSLGHEFVTDVVQLQFHHAPPSATSTVALALSLAYAVVEGAAEVLEVPSNDLSTTVHSGQHEVPPIILYDNVPGGAGLVARLEQEDVLRNCLQAALKRVEGGCGCAPNTSCYGCLRSYRNQFAHEILQRGPVLDYLRGILTEWK
jgi:hypothetical protein